jgi:RNA polymerase sigma-54 factor
LGKIEVKKWTDEELAELEKLVSEEDPKHPLTDQAIVNILKEGGVQIARRTVAKYRDQLGVLSARMRKRV